MSFLARFLGNLAISKVTENNPRYGRKPSPVGVEGTTLFKEGFIRDNSINHNRRKVPDERRSSISQIQNPLALGKWQSLTLAAFSVGVMETRRCTLSIVSEALGLLGKADSVERRLQRWLNNAHLQREEYPARWRQWLWQKLDMSQMVTVLVDETKLSNHLSIMVVGLAYKQRCLPLAWRCYAPKAWSEEQVELISGLLQAVKATLPAEVEVLVEADRGIGTSPDLVRAVTDILHWHYLFRVQGITHFQSDHQTDTELRALTQRGGKVYRDSGQVFKSAGWLDAHVRVIWDAPYDQPWCLISDLSSLSGRE